MSKAKKDKNERVRKIGEREEQIVHKLSANQLEEVKDRVMSHLDELDSIESKKAESVANFKAQAASFELQLEADRKLLKSGVDKRMVIVDEFLTQGNEVVRVRRDTGEQLGARTATANELQEEMFTGPPPVDMPPEQQPDATEPLSEDEIAFAGQADVFGETS